jgi:hypothetical protein
VVAALTSLLVKRGFVTEAELVDELWRQRGAQQG